MKMSADGSGSFGGACQVPSCRVLACVLILLSVMLFNSRDIVASTTSTPIANGTVRLVGSNNSNEGRIEILHNGVWGTVCDDLWGLEEAQVICRMLGYRNVSAKLIRFSGGIDPIWLDNVKCIGNESDITECCTMGWGIQNCGHSEDVGVRCSDPGPVPTTSSNPAPIVYNTSIRLAGGCGPHEGRIEVFHDGVWGTVCDDYWHLEDAQVICRMLGYSYVVDPLVWYREGSGQIWLGDVSCLTGNESDIAACCHRGWGIENCGHSEDVGLRCGPVPTTHSSLASTTPTPIENGTVRLVDGCSPNQGRIEILHDGVWGTVCDDSWDLENAQVICRMLGYRNVSEALWDFPYGSGQIWLDDVVCFPGHGSDLSACCHRGWGKENCGHSEDVGLICSDPGPVPTTPSNPAPTLIRLVGSNSSNEGRIEVFHDGVWGTVCDDYWDLEDALVACRMLGYRNVSAKLVRFSGGSDPIWLDNVACTGNESDIADCCHMGWGNENCRHSEDVGVNCSDPEPTVPPTTAPPTTTPAEPTTTVPPPPTTTPAEPTTTVPTTTVTPTTAPPTTTPLGCPADFTMLNDRCYFIHKPVSITGFSQATGECNAKGAKLVALETPEEYNLVKQKISEIMGGAIINKNFWTSAREIAPGRAKAWVWKSTKTAVSNIMWAPGEPSGQSTCGALYGYDDYKLVDVSCHTWRLTEHYGYICEKPKG